MLYWKQQYPTGSLNWLPCRQPRKVRVVAAGIATCLSVACYDAKCNSALNATNPFTHFPNGDLHYSVVNRNYSEAKKLIVIVNNRKEPKHFFRYSIGLIPLPILKNCYNFIIVTQRIYTQISTLKFS